MMHAKPVSPMARPATLSSDEKLVLEEITNGCAQIIHMMNLTIFGLETFEDYMLKTILLLTASNIFMTFAWYGHLKFKRPSIVESDTH